jgi:hypothetical protein
MVRTNVDMCAELPQPQPTEIIADHGEVIDLPVVKGPSLLESAEGGGGKSNLI